MYHFVAESLTVVPIELARNPMRNSCKYLKAFQLDAVRFLYRQYKQNRFSVLNDESGLGKVASVAVFLNAAMVLNHRCLIIVPHDEAITGWQFHMSLLTSLPVSIMNNYLPRAPPVLKSHIYLSKWSTLQYITDWQNDFDFVIVDNRGQMLNNSFCCATIIKHFEGKVNIIISSADITANTNLLYTVLRLGGRLEHQHTNYKAFQSKFQLPEAKDIVNRVVDLEQYFLRREMISDYCRDFRMRRYRHQYENVLPLVAPDRYKSNLALWRTTSLWTEPTVVSDTATEDLMEIFYRQQLRINRHCTWQKKKTTHERQVVANTQLTEDVEPPMSPLLFVSDSDDEEQRGRVNNGSDPQILETEHQVEVVDLTTETEKSTDADEQMNKLAAIPADHTEEIVHLEQASVAEVNRSAPPETGGGSTAKQSARKKGRPRSEGTKKNVGLSKRIAESGRKRGRPRSEGTKENIGSSESIAESARKRGRLRSERTNENVGLTNENVGSTNENVGSTNENVGSTNENVGSSERIAESGRKRGRPRSEGTKQKRIAGTARKRGRPRKSAEDVSASAESYKPHIEQTRGPKRITRSTADANCIIAALDSPAKRKKTPQSKKRNSRQVQPDANAAAATTAEKAKTPPRTGTKKTSGNDAGHSVSQVRRLSQISLISTSDYKDIECGQRLLSHESTSAENATRMFSGGSWDKFVVPNPPPPPFPLSNSSLTMVVVPVNAMTCTDSDANSIGRSAPASESQSQSSRRTRALKHQRPDNDRPVALLTATHRSPDLFSNCSDLELICTQSRATFNALSCHAETKNLQQQHALSQQRRLPTRKRSCLEILEQIVDLPATMRRTKGQSNAAAIVPHPSQMVVNPQTPSSNDNAGSGQPNKITNYLQRMPTRKSSNQKAKLRNGCNHSYTIGKSSPKSPRAKPVQGTKLTRWLPQTEAASVTVFADEERTVVANKD